MRTDRAPKRCCALAGRGRTLRSRRADRSRRERRKQRREHLDARGVLAQERREQQEEVEDREGEEVARRPRARLDVIERFVALARAGALAGPTARQPERENEEHETAQTGDG